MNLRFVGQILLKDARRLWWAIALTFALLSRLAYFDSWRTGATPGSDEGWLYILLPLAWSFLIALAVLEDPIVGDSPFWVIVPCRWPSLLTAKTLFVAVFIHLPYFVACIAIVQARGFAPSQHLSVLLDRQVILLALTLPAMALATMVGNVTRFMIVAIVLAAIAGAPPFSVDEQRDAHQLREVVLFSIIAIAAVNIAIVQYWHRATKASRWAGMFAVLIAGVIWWLPWKVFNALLVATSPAMPRTSIRVKDGSAPQDRQQVYNFGKPDAIRTSIPLTVSGLAEGQLARFRLIDTRLQEPDGHSETMQTTEDVYRPYQFGPANPGPLVTDLVSDPGNIPRWQQTSIGKDLMNRIRDEPVTVQGRVSVAYYRESSPVWSSFEQHVTVAGIGKCLTTVAGYNPASEVLRIVCETPGKLRPVNTRIFDPQGNRDWNHSLGEASSVNDYPVNTWLSPVDRHEVFVGFTDEDHYDPKRSTYVIPREIVPSLKVAYTYEIPQGRAVIGYELPNIRLGQYVVR